MECHFNADNEVVRRAMVNGAEVVERRVTSGIGPNARTGVTRTVTRGGHADDIGRANDMLSNMSLGHGFSNMSNQMGMTQSYSDFSNCDFSVPNMPRGFAMNQCSMGNMEEEFNRMMGQLHNESTGFCRPASTFSSSTKKTVPKQAKARVSTWEINLNEVTREKNPIGRGSFGAVYKGMFNGKTVAVKVMLDSDMMTKDQFIKEAEMARDCSHENIVKAIALCKSNPPFFVTEFLNGGSLRGYLENMKRSGKKLSESQFRSVGIARAMAHLERNDIVHRDLAARNVLVGNSIDTIKLADFGLARCLDQESYYHQRRSIFPFRWTAPESIQSKKFTHKSDVWSYAVVLWELYNMGMKIPYDGITDAQLVPQLKAGHRLSRPADCSQEMYNTMLQCWSLNPASRPTFKKLAEM